MGARVDKEGDQTDETPEGMEVMSLQDEISEVLYPTDFDKRMPEIDPVDKRWLELYRKGLLKESPENVTRAVNLLDSIRDNEPVLNRKPVTPNRAPSRRSKTRNLIKLKKENSVAEVSFNYDQNLVEICRSLPYHMRKYDNNAKAWIVELRENGKPSLVTIMKLEQLVEQNEFQISQNDAQTLVNMVQEEETTNESMAQSAIESHATDAEIHVEGLGGELRPFQRAGVAYASEKCRTFIADEMGLGKTVQALGVLENLKSYPCLIVVPASLRTNWMREVNKWLPRRWASFEPSDMKYPLTKVLIMSYNMIKSRYDQIEEVEWKAMVFDESHKMKNAKTGFFKTAHDLVRVARPKVRLCLTGTPIENKPEEYLSQLKILDRVDAVDGERMFVDKYCHRDYQGNLINLEELNLKLRSSCFIRRMKKDVLKELPEKQRAVLSMEITNRKEYDEAEKDLVSWLKKQAKDEEDARKIEAKLTSAESLAKISYLKQIAAEGKLKAVKEWIKDLIDQGEKLIVFGFHKKIQEAIYDEFRDVAVWTRKETTSQVAVDLFQNKESIKIIVCSQSADYAGLTLTKASNVLHTELWWNASVHDQCDDRAHRIGQRDSVTGWYAVAKGTIDEPNYELIESKRKVTKAAVDGGVKSTETSAVMELINKMLKRN